MIQGSSLTRLRVMEFFTLVSNINDYLTGEDLVALKLDAIHTGTYLPAFTAFDAAIQPFRTTGLTETLLEYDRERDDALVGLRRIATSYSKFPKPELKTAAENLLLTLDKYGKAPYRLGLSEQTGVVINLLQDLDEAALKSDIALLGATAWVDVLRDANSRFVETFQERIEREAQQELGITKSTRDAMQEALTQTCDYINALALIEGEAAYSTLIDNINREIDRSKSIVKQRDSARATRIEKK